MKLNIYNFNTDNVIYINCMFNQCSSLIELYISDFGNSNIINNLALFDGCPDELKLKIEMKNKIISEFINDIE